MARKNSPRDEEVARERAARTEARVARARKLFFEVVEIIENESGTTTSSACRRVGVPTQTFCCWLDYPERLRLQKDEVFGKYSRAIDISVTRMMEEIEALAAGAHRPKTGDGHHEKSTANVNRDRLRVDTKKWLLAKMMRNRFADISQHEHSGRGGEPIDTTVKVEFV